MKKSTIPQSCLLIFLKTSIVLFILAFTLLSKPLLAQCPTTSFCEGTPIYCGFNDINGILCTTIRDSITNSHLSHLCSGTGIPTNLSWWGFVGRGEAVRVTFTLNSSSCEQNVGIQAGIFEGGCDGSKILDCNLQCNTSKFILEGETRKYKNYYVWVDGCDFDVCEYRILATARSSTFPIQLPKLSPLLGGSIACPCKAIKLCTANFGGAFPHLSWTVDGINHKGTDCISYVIPPYSKPGQKIKICMTAILGDPIFPESICDQDSVCKIIVVRDVELEVGEDIHICYDEQPYYWHGIRFDSSCINPPCTVRAQTFDLCCVDSVRRLIFMAPSPNVGILDTFICGDEDLVLSDGQKISGTLCEKEVFIDTGLECDSILHLILRRPSFNIDWTLDSINNQICPNIKRKSICGITDSSAYQLIWIFDGVVKDTLPSDSCFTIISDGTYEVQIFIDAAICSSSSKYKFILEDGRSKLFVQINGKDTLCRGSGINLSVDGNFDTYYWSNGLTGPINWITRPGEYCVTAKLDKDSLEFTTCHQITESYIKISSLHIIPDDGTSSGVISVELSGSDDPFDLLWNTGENVDIIAGLKNGQYTLRATNHRGCTNIFAFTVPLETKSNHILSNVKINIFPNPTSNLLFIESEKQIQNVNIIDALARKEVDIQYQKTGMDITKLRSGIYFLEITFKDSSKKVVTFLKR